MANFLCRSNDEIKRSLSGGSFHVHKRDHNEVEETSEKKASMDLSPNEPKIEIQIVIEHFY